MKRKLKSDRGFTLAELLIVVAIIGVLVAIAIPIFTSQLERSREAVDLSDVRSAYAEVMMAAITGDTSATYTKDSGQKIYKEMDGTYSIMVTPLKSQYPYSIRHSCFHQTYEMKLYHQRIANLPL